MDINKNEIGKRIFLIRKSLGLTMKEFGERIGNPVASDSIVSRWEKGVSLPNNERLKRIAELGDITVDELLYGYNEELLVQAKLDKWDSNSKKVLLDYLENDLQNATPEESFTLAKYIDLLKTYSDNPQFIGHFQSLFHLFIDLKEEIKETDKNELDEIVEIFETKVKAMVEAINASNK